MIFVKVIEELLKFFFPMCPNKENINITKPYQWLRLLTFTKLSFCFIHKNASLCRSEFFQWVCPILAFNFEFEVVVVKHKFCHFN